MGDSETASKFLVHNLNVNTILAVVLNFPFTEIILASAYGS